VALVLVVDDDLFVLDVCCAALTQAWHAVERASSGLAALKIILGKEPLDLLLTDVVMPGLHGFNLARMARLRRPGLRVLYMTAFADLDTVLKDDGPRLGTLLRKPLRPDELRHEVDEALALPALNVVT
jgi:DNA-binding NtrC family response regulator